MLVCAGLATAAQAQDRVYDLSTAALTNSSFGNRAPAIATTDFELPYVVGPIAGQSGWTAHATAIPFLNVSTANPASGSQHLRMTETPTVGNGTLQGAFSPTAPLPANTPDITNISFNISNLQGADYTLIGQAPSQAFLSWRIALQFDGDIAVLDDVGLGLAFVDTGTDWTAGTYNTISVNMDPLANSIVYSLNGTPFYTSVTGVVAGTAVEQIVLINDSWQLAGETGDFDSINSVPTPGAFALLGLGGLLAARRRR
jgi:hypothetical protein